MDQGAVSGEPLVSVVMCTYNGMGFVEAAVADILAQTYRNWELIVSDDGSSDGTREWLERWQGDHRIRLFFQDENLGYVGNKNFALAQARGEYITQQDQDDRSSTERLERQVAALQRTGLSICGCGYRRIGLDGAVLFEVSCGEERVIAGKPDGDYPFWFPALMAHRRVHREVGDYPAYFAGAFGDDLYWTVRANERFEILCLAEPLYDYRDAPASITSLMDDPRKLVMGEMLARLIEQRRSCGTDDLEQGDLAKLQQAERELMADRAFLAGRYQLYAARSIDQQRWRDARTLLGKAFATSPARPQLARTAFYYLRKRARL